MWPVSVFMGRGGGSEGAGDVVLAVLPELAAWVAGTGAALEGAACDVCGGGDWELVACPACASGAGASGLGTGGLGARNARHEEREQKQQNYAPQRLGQVRSFRLVRR
jgi:hypothetical protein